MPSFSNQFSSALPYKQYFAFETEEQQRRWMQLYDIARLDATRGKDQRAAVHTRSSPHWTFSNRRSRWSVT